MISPTVLFTHEAKWELMVAYLKNSAKDVSQVSRNNDRALSMILGGVKAGDKDLVKRLMKEKALNPQDIYYVGFHFSEKLFAEKEFGVNLLKALIKKGPRTQVGIQAKKRLQTVGTASAIMSTN